MATSRKVAVVALVGLGLLGGGIQAASAAPPNATYTITVGAKGSWTTPTDTPAGAYVDKDGTFYFQQSAALYGATEPRKWDFYTGTNFDTATKSTAISNAVNPNNADDKNNDTTWRCNNSPTGLESTFAPSGSSYSQKNFCDLAGVWVDPDTGDWYGLVHNEFTPQPFGDGLHYDAIDYAVSTNQGKTWTIKSHVITSPYSTKRNDTTGFPNQTYSYGDGDQRLLVDTASGYFYVYYGSRIVDKSGSWKNFREHVARAKMSSKMAPSSWQKWYDGAWSQPGVGGLESNLVPVDASNSTGYTPLAKEYKPTNTGTADQQVAAGTLSPTSPLFVMDVAYDAYLGLYIGEPQAVRQDGNEPQHFYVTDDLTTQKWYEIGTTGSYTTASWYRWFVDSANKTSSAIIGKSFRSYCSFGCSGGASGEYVNLTVDSTAPAAAPLDLTKTYRIANGGGRILAQQSGTTATTSVGTASGSALEAWYFVANGDGSYRILNSSTGQALGVDSGTTTSRAWGTKPTATSVGSSRRSAVVAHQELRWNVPLRQSAQRSRPRPLRGQHPPRRDHADPRLDQLDRQRRRRDQDRRGTDPQPHPGRHSAPEPQRCPHHLHRRKGARRPRPQYGAWHPTDHLDRPRRHQPEVDVHPAVGRFLHADQRIIRSLRGRQRRRHHRRHRDHPVDLRHRHQPTLDRHQTCLRQLHPQVGPKRSPADHGLQQRRRQGHPTGRHQLTPPAMDHQLTRAAVRASVSQAV